MATDSIFPTDAKDAEETYKNLVARGRELRAPHQCQWYYTNAYCAGARNCVLNYQKGTVKASFTDSKGRVHFVYEELLAKYATQKGRLLGMDLSPRVVRRNDSLDGQRDAATVQAVLTHLFPHEKVEKLKKAILQPFLFYGTLGLSLWEDADEPKDQNIHLIPPWQMTPIPTTVTHPIQARGMIVRKQMPVEEIKRKYRQMKLRQKALSEAETTTVNRADTPPSLTDGSGEHNHTGFDNVLDDFNQTASKSKDGADKGKTSKMEIGWLGIVYLWDERNFMTERLLFLGSKLLARDTYWGTKTYKQITTIHDMDIGGFWSRAWMELQIPINSEQEGAIGRTFQNVKDLDLYGKTLVPTNFGINRHSLATPQAGGPAYQPYEWDALSPGGQNIVQLRPFTSGNFAVQALAQGMAISDRMGKQPEMLSGDAPGRVDSAAALGTLLESGNTGLAPSALSIAHGFSEIYQAAVCNARKTFNIGDTIAVTMLDDSLIGVVYDAGTGTVKLSESGVPHPDSVAISVKSMAPISKQQQVLQLQNSLKLEIIEPWEYRILSRRMNLELPVGNNIEWESYLKARLENAVLFHDGKTVPEGAVDAVGVLFSQEADMHELHIAVHRELISSVKFAMAGVAVRKRIMKHLQLHEDAMGKIPEGMELPEDEALMAEQMAAQQGGGLPGGMPQSQGF